MSSPNQKKITINKPKYDKEFIENNGAFMQIGVAEWQDAYNAFKGNSTAIALYFYLASNADQYKKDLSFEAFSNCINRSKSSYHRAVELLTESGYLYEDNCGRFNFATIPKKGLRTATQNWETEEAKEEPSKVKDEMEKSQNCNASNPKVTIEIDNKYKTDTTKKIDSPSSSKDYSYLDALVDYDDGSYMWNGSIRFIDGNDPKFYERPKGYQAARMAETTPFDMGAIEHILSKMEEQNNE